MTVRRLPALAGALLGGNAPLWSALLPAIAFVATMLQLALSPVDPDYWWHIATGRWMLDHGRVPTTDPFSFTHGGQHWYAHEWLSELILGIGDRIAGYAAGVVLTALAVAAGAWLSARAARYYGVGAREALALVVGASFLILGNLAVRPQVWGWALLALLVHELAAHDVGRRSKLWHLPLLFALWINVHLSALVGGGALALYVLHRLLGWRTGRGEERNCQSRAFVHAFLAAALSALALCVNPRGPALVWFTRVYANQHAVRYRYIGEWQRPRFSGSDRLLFIAAGVAVAVVLGTMLWRRRLWPGVLVLVFAAAALRATRYVPLFALVMIPAAGWAIAALVPAWRGRTLRTIVVPAGLAVAMACAAVAAVAVVLYARGPSEFRRVADARRGGYPVAAAAFIGQNLPQARLFNEYGWGGFLIYTFAPQRRVYMDGREEMYGERFFDRFVRTIGAEPGWQQTLAAADIGATVIDPRGPLAAAMDGDPGWRRVFADSVAVVFVPSSPASAVNQTREERKRGLLSTGQDAGRAGKALP